MYGVLTTAQAVVVRENHDDSGIDGTRVPSASAREVAYLVKVTDREVI